MAKLIVLFLLKTDFHKTLFALEIRERLGANMVAHETDIDFCFLNNF